MSEPTNEPVTLTSYQLRELIRPVILAHTKNENYTNKVIDSIDFGQQLRIGYEMLSPAGMLAYTAISLLDPVDLMIIEVVSNVLIDRLRTAEPPADLPARDRWYEARQETLDNYASAVAVGAIDQIEIHSITSDDLAVDWSQLNGLGESND